MLYKCSTGREIWAELLCGTNDHPLAWCLVMGLDMVTEMCITVATVAAEHWTYFSYDQGIKL